jgi:RHS repeat-associated protein
MTGTDYRVGRIRKLDRLVSVAVGTALLLGCLPQTSFAEHITYIYTDLQGTPLAAVDGGSGVLTPTDYRPYGQSALGPDQDGVGYTGHVRDIDVGLVYMQARYYDPDSGRFLSIDPSGPITGGLFQFNRYTYAEGNPIGNTDPDGRVVTSVNPENNARVLGFINSRSSLQYGFDSNDHLVAKNGAPNKSGSSYYSSAISNMIAAKTDNLVAIAQTAPDSRGRIIDVDAVSGGGSTVPRADGSVAITISGHSNNSAQDTYGNPLVSSPDDILMHEIVGHGAPLVGYPDTGNAVDDENKARREIPGMQQRKRESGHIEGSQKKNIDTTQKCGQLCSN